MLVIKKVIEGWGAGMHYRTSDIASLAEERNEGNKTGVMLVSRSAQT